MANEFSIMDRLTLAFKVMTQWETLATLAAFIAFWLLIRYVADPWRERSPRLTMGSRKAARKAPPQIPDDVEAPDDDDDVLPD
ncbi:MAG: hypothetical protein JXM71_07240 [Spirochaetales bacterium]|nr:hypothetical protein [Spirochaetales bacterium]